MAEITITVDEKEITNLVTEKIAEDISREYGTMARDAKYGIRKGVETAVKNYIYDRKDAIIEKCVARASAELVRKGIPKLLERTETRDE